jgi:hypothetical protein
MLFFSFIENGVRPTQWPRFDDFDVGGGGPSVLKITLFNPYAISKT